jgi:hypothetical protein
MGSGPYCLAPDERPPRYDDVCAHWYRDLQVAASGRLRVLRSKDSALELGAGLSAGGFTWVEFTLDAPAYKSAERAYWANLEIGYAFRTRSGFSARAFMGHASLLNPSALECISWGAGSRSYSHCERDHEGDGQHLIYFGAGGGWAF